MTSCICNECGDVGGEHLGSCARKLSEEDKQLLETLGVLGHYGPEHDRVSCKRVWGVTVFVASFGEWLKTKEGRFAEYCAATGRAAPRSGD